MQSPPYQQPPQLPPQQQQPQQAPPPSYAKASEGRQPQSIPQPFTPANQKPNYQSTYLEPIDVPDVSPKPTPSPQPPPSPPAGGYGGQSKPPEPDPRLQGNIIDLKNLER